MVFSLEIKGAPTSAYDGNSWLTKEEVAQFRGGAGSSINMAAITADPDGDSSWLCSACTLPIFSTPAVSHGLTFLHDQCTNLAPQMLHELHPHPLVLHHISNSTLLLPTCCNCSRTCGTFFYQCPHSDSCDFRLDLVCVVPIRIMHRSHQHTMMVIRQRDAASLTCGACDTKHDPSLPDSPTLSYLCNLCGYWVHPDCASLPNAIVRYQHHHHCLFLTYNLPNATRSKCFICNSVPKRSSGVYICPNCPHYLVHIKCALTRPSNFNPVFIREAKVAELCRLPFSDENTSLIPYIRESSSSGDDHLDQDQQRIHPHPLIFHKIDDDKNQSQSVCNACAQSISPPFFSCSHCPNFFLHSCCANLPIMIVHRVHTHPLLLSPKSPKSDMSAAFTCKGCKLRCNGFAYSCPLCDDFTMDLTCAFINPAITHAAHKSSHILFMCRDVQFGGDQSCNCCRSELSGICYECSICSNFKLHVRCALLPSTLRHVLFDKHPLQLITTDTNGDDEFCEICEKEMDTKRWYYGCFKCNQAFHIDCIPSVDQLSRMKLGSSIHVGGHDCDMALVREDNVVCGGHRCGICGESFKALGNGLAYLCSRCYFGIHYHCAEKRLLKS